MRFPCAQTGQVGRSPDFRLRWALALAMVMAARVSISAEEPVADAKELPRIPPVEAKEAVKTFKVRPG